MELKNLIVGFIILWSFSFGMAQEDLLSLLGDEERTDYTIATFKANRVINLHSVENTPGGVLDVKINHRFGFINAGIDEFFGLDQAQVRIGADYGVTDLLMVGVGRSSFQKILDGFVKYKLLRQSTGVRRMPVTLSLLGTTAVQTGEYPNQDISYEFRHRLFYTAQIIAGRKFSESLSLQISPTYVHRNLVRTNAESNGIMACGFAGRMKLTKRTSLNAEYIYVFPDQIDEVQFNNSFSIGFDIETGGHVFQLHFTNSTSMIEKGFIGETRGDFFEGDIHFGFNISRVFTLAR
jgi:hypothetical protein